MKATWTNLLMVFMVLGLVTQFDCTGYAAWDQSKTDYGNTVPFLPDWRWKKTPVN